MRYFYVLLIIVVLSSASFFFIEKEGNPFVKDLGNPVTLEDKYVSPISIEYLRSLKINSDKLVVEKLVSENIKYKSYLSSYYSDGFKIYAQLTIPKSPKPENGYPVIIFNHGYIPPKSYNTFSNYSAYVDYLARNDFVVLKIDMRGHGSSEGQASGTYFSSTYLKDVLAAKKAIQKFENIDPNNIGLWGHSMSGNLVLRSMLVDNEFKAGVIWAGAVYSYEDFYKYRISDSSYQAPVGTSPDTGINLDRETSAEITKFRSREEKPDFQNEFWKSISLTENIRFLSNPIQIHHSVNDNVVNVGYSRDLAKVLEDNNKNFEYHEYSGGGHNITGIYFNEAMSKTVKFFKQNLK